MRTRRCLGWVVALVWLQGCVGNWPSSARYERVADNLCATGSNVRFKTISDSTVWECAQAAHAARKMSFNIVGMGVGRVGSCHVLTFDSPPAALTSINNCTYYQITTAADFGPCHSNPCLNGGRCSVAQSLTGFRCQCQFPTGGPLCKDAVCRNCTLSTSGLAVFLFTNESLSWNGAKQRCEDRQMTLHMPKTAALFNSLRRFLGQLYASATQAREQYWIGLSRSAANASWRWVDGSQLRADDFQAWSGNRPRLGLSVLLPNTAEFNFSWWDDNGSGTSTYHGQWNFYHICEKHYSFLSNVSAA